MRCDSLPSQKLKRWESLGEAPEYYQLKNRGPHKPTISHPLNRFGGNMGPYADSLLPLKTVKYINASPIDNLGNGMMPFVATMCPKRETFAHFWSMVWEVDSRIIVNLTHEKDRVGSSASDKRERYWPPLSDEAGDQQIAHWPVQPVLLATEVCEQLLNQNLLRYTIELRGPLPPTHDEAAGGAAAAERPKRIVWLYWYSRWVDFPSSSSIGARPFYQNAWAVLHVGLHVMRRMEELGESHWAVCHCSAGVGRTGTFIALIDLLRRLPSLEEDAVALDEAVTATIEAMRERRLWMVKTDIEYATLYACLFLKLRNPDDDDFELSWLVKADEAAAAGTDAAAAHGRALHPDVAGLVAEPSSRPTVPTSATPAARGSGRAAAAGGARSCGAPSSTSSGRGARQAADPMAVEPVGTAEPASSSRGGSRPTPAQQQRRQPSKPLQDQREQRLSVRTPEDEEESAATATAAIRPDAAIVDNEADVAHYDGIGMTEAPMDDDAGGMPSVEKRPRHAV